jgi:hypothetical protein
MVELLKMCRRVPGNAIPGLGLVAITLMVSAAVAEPQGALCRVNNRLASASNVGSGTLVDKSEDGREGLILTCAHLFTEGVGQVVVVFPGGKSHGAKLVAIDREADLAALAISNPAGESAAISFDLEQSQAVRACGFGPHGEYACAEGPVVGQASSTGQVSVMIGDAVRSGDSGGGVFDEQGNLVAVVWGEAGGMTYASTGPPLRSFLDRVLGRRTGYVYTCPGGVCPRPFGGGGVANTPSSSTPPPAHAGGSPRWDELERRVAALEQGKQVRGDYVTRGELAEYLPRSEVGGLVAKPQAAGKILELLGISGPAGWGVVAATSVGGWLLGRLMKRGAGGRRGETFQ